MGRWRDIFNDGLEDNTAVYCKDKDLEILDKLGEGQYGVVHRVRYGEEKRQAAYKRLQDEDADDKENMRMLMEEARALLVFDNDSIVKCLGLVYDNTDPNAPAFCGFLAELLDGSLAQYLVETANNDDIARAVVPVLYDIMEGVAMLHAVGLVHRDLHGGNILRKGTRFRVSDLGTSTWGRAGLSAWKQGWTNLPGRFDTAPEIPAPSEAPRSLESYDMVGVAILAARLILWASGAPYEQWDDHGDKHSHWAKRGTGPSLEMVRNAQATLLQRADKVCQDRGLDPLAKLVALCAGSAGAISLSPTDALKSVQDLRLQYCSISSGVEAEERRSRVLETLAAITDRTEPPVGGPRWVHLRVLGIRNSPRNISYELRLLKPTPKASSPPVTGASPVQDEIVRLCDQGYMRAAYDKVVECETAGGRPCREEVYLHLLRALRKARRPYYLDDIEELWGHMLMRNPKPSAAMLLDKMGAYAAEGRMAEAEEIFLDIQSQVKGVHAPEPILVDAYTSLMEGYAECRDDTKVEHLLAQMQTAGLRPTVMTYTPVLKVYCYKGLMKKAEGVLQRMTTRSPSGRWVTPNVHTFGVLLEGYCDAGDIATAEVVLRRVRRAKLKPTSYLYDQLIGACGDDEVTARRLKDEMKRDNLIPTAWTLYSLFKVMLKVRGEDLDGLVVSLFEELKAQDRKAQRVVMTPSDAYIGPYCRGVLIWRLYRVNRPTDFLRVVS